MSDDSGADVFFRDYAAALLRRDAPAIAGRYAVPALILFPEQSLAVSSAAQTEEFFAGAFAQYEGVTEAHADIVVVARTEHSLWADVTWTYDGAASERNMYQLVLVRGEWRIAVLTPM